MANLTLCASPPSSTNPQNPYLTKPAPSNPRKRSPTVAFSSDATPPSSRPPSRTHTKRLHLRRALSDRPAWVSLRPDSRQIAPRIPPSSCFNLQTPSPDNTYTPQVTLPQLLQPGGNNITVLCFIGGTRVVLDSLAQVKGVLHGLGANVMGVSLTDVNGVEVGVPVVWDRERVLARGMGMLHPLGGGRVALDAVVVLDEEWRERVVLPVGWGVRGAGRDAESVLENVVGRVVRAVEWLREEWEERVRRESAMEVEMGGVVG
ncbi:hypothetical protein EX30DRAFT_373452 [Ascodesmis nigricans]|uniref:Uncharacterized protein n=1 Tax=Ascodesmis nigricans TaxID=341454 RepID=A0A4S2MP26_9PEZI|nr:hypothetical protein EX30DRAFT_373452 [Ascodesmis nigricans]